MIDRKQPLHLELSVVAAWLMSFDLYCKNLITLFFCDKMAGKGR